MYSLDVGKGVWKEQGGGEPQGLSPLYTQQVLAISYSHHLPSVVGTTDNPDCLITYMPQWMQLQHLSSYADGGGVIATRGLMKAPSPAILLLPLHHA